VKVENTYNQAYLLRSSSHHAFEAALNQWRIHDIYLAVATVTFENLSVAPQEIWKLHVEHENKDQSVAVHKTLTTKTSTFSGNWLSAFVVYLRNGPEKGPKRPLATPAQHGPLIRIHKH